jgi:hypothetical protein
MWIRFLLSVVLMIVLMSFPGVRPATATMTARQGVVYELGADVFSTLPRAMGYQWYAAGYVFPAGAHDGLGQCDRPDWRASIGTYAIYGVKGDQSYHQATYRFTIKGESYYFQGEIPALDEAGNPATSLFTLTLKVNGQFVDEDPRSEAIYTPRSTSCFGGTVMLFKGVPISINEQPAPSLEDKMKLSKLGSDTPEEECYLFDCPGCECAHFVRVAGTPPCWQWNGKLDKPTFSPSILVNYGDGRICHSFVTDGRIQFLGDSSHALKGKTVEIPEWDAEPDSDAAAARG